MRSKERLIGVVPFGEVPGLALKVIAANISGYFKLSADILPPLENPEFALDDKAPGYRWLVLYADGRIDTGVCRLPFMPDEVEMNSDGY